MENVCFCRIISRSKYIFLFASSILEYGYLLQNITLRVDVVYQNYQYFLQLVPRLQQLYGSIENLDLYIGGLLERKDSDAILGPTFKCLVGDQFRRIRLGDRFWYEEPNQAGSFTIGNNSLPFNSLFHQDIDFKYISHFENHINL